jgi:hypothetical protein
MEDKNVKKQTKIQTPQDPVLKERAGFHLQGHLKIYDPNTKEVFVNKRNAIHYENMSYSLAQAFGEKGIGTLYSMNFGNGGASVDPTGVITYLPPNTVNQNATLYNQTYAKIIDNNNPNNPDPVHNYISINHVPGMTYTDIIVTCLLDYGEPPDQQAFDNSTQTNGTYVFNEIGLFTYQGTQNAETLTRLVTHVIFHPVQKSLNRQIQIDYTIRIQALTNLSQA